MYKALKTTCTTAKYIYDIKEDVIKQFLEDNYDISGSYTIKKVNNKFIVDVKGDVWVKNTNITSLTNDFFEFGSVSGDFDCDGCELLTTLKGAPKEVGGGFNCSGCKSLKTLEGAPRKVGRGFNCSGCKRLTSLKGAPETVGWGFYCISCKRLTSLKGAPKEVFGDFHCHGCGTQFTEEDVRKYTKVNKNIYA